jgi:hypothetical protein
MGYFPIHLLPTCSRRESVCPPLGTRAELDPSQLGFGKPPPRKQTQGSSKIGS